MMNEFLKSAVVHSQLATPTGSGGPVVLTSTGDKFIFTPAAPIRVMKWGVLLDVSLNTTSSQLILNLDKRITAGTDTGRVNLDTLTVPVTNTTYVAGKGIYRDPFTASTEASTPSSMPVNSGPQGYTQKIDSGQGNITVKPGEQLVVKVATAAGTAGSGYAFIEYVLLPISKPSGYGTTDAGTVSLTENLNRFAS